MTITLNNSKKENTQAGKHYRDYKKKSRKDVQKVLHRKIRTKQRQPRKNKERVISGAPEV